MGRNTKQKRKTSSESDTEGQSKKQFNHGAKGTKGARKIKSLDVSEILSEANSLIYDRTGESDINTDIDSDSEQEHGTNLSVFSPLSQPASQITGTTLSMNVKSSDSGKLDTIISTVTELKNSQDGMKSMFEKKLDQMRNELVENIDKKVKLIRDDFAQELGRETKHIDSLLTTVHSFKSRLDTLEETDRSLPTSDANNGQDQGASRFITGHSDDSDISIIAEGVPHDTDENLLQKAQNIINALGDEVSSAVAITGVTRFKTRLQNKPGLVKVSFRNVKEKVIVLRNKMMLKDLPDYSSVYLKSCKSRAERLMETNARTLLRQLPGGNKFRVNTSGRIQQRVRQDDANTGH